MTKKRSPRRSNGKGPNGKNPTSTNIKDTSGCAQRRRIAEYLVKNGKATTIELREECNALYAPSRIFELRHHLGWQIDTVEVSDFDPKGRKHSGVGMYVVKHIGLMP